MTVDNYIDSFDLNTKEKLLSIKNLLINHFPGIEFKISYDIIGCFLNHKKVFFGAYKNHIGIYGAFGYVNPIEIPQIKHKGKTFYLSLNQPLPFDELLHIFSHTLK